MSSPTLKQLHIFHAQDREIFSKLVIKFSRPPAESLLVMATWFWLEDFYLHNILSIISPLDDSFTISLADEAVSCFQSLESTKLPNDLIKIPLTAKFMNKDITIQVIHEHRYSAIRGIRNFLTTVCSRIFSDILQQILPSSLIIPGFPHPTFGNINGDDDLFPKGLWVWNTNCFGSENERTVFLTFSRGFPVTQVEVRDLFTEKYGENCVESVYMQVYNDNSHDVDSNCQSLYAKLVLDSVVTVDRILKGQKLEKFWIRGKHIWARKFEDIKKI